MPYAIYLLIALQVLDIVSTVIALRKTNVREANPVMAWLMEKVGVMPALVLTKGVVIGVFLYLQDQIPVQIVLMLCAVYTYVVVNNFRNAK